MASWLPSQYEDEMVCQLCWGEVLSPINLQCGHSFCRGCWQERFRRSTEKHLPCPVCRPSPTIEENENEPQYSPIETTDTVEPFEPEEPCSDIPCLVCEAVPPRDAVTSCLHCKLSYCESCLQILHPNRGIFRNHELAEPRLSFDVPMDNLCDVHQEKLSLYCKECQRLSCLICERIGKHKDHRVVDVQTAFNHLQVELRGKYNYLQSRVEKFLGDLQKMDSTYQTQKRMVQQFHERVQFAYDNLISVLEDRRTAVLSTHKKKLEVARNQIISDSVCVKSALEDNERCLALLRDYFVEPDEVEFIKAAPALKMRLDSAIRLSHQTEKHTPQCSVRTEDPCTDILHGGSYNVVITDTANKDNTVTLKVKKGRLVNPSCAVQ